MPSNFLASEYQSFKMIADSGRHFCGTNQPLTSHTGITEDGGTEFVGVTAATVITLPVHASPTTLSIWSHPHELFGCQGLDHSLSTHVV